MNTLSERRSGFVLPAESAPVGFKRDTALVVVRSRRAVSAKTDEHTPNANGNSHCRASNGSSAEAGSPATTRSHASIDAMLGDQGSRSPSRARVSQSRRKGQREGRALHDPGWDSSWDPSVADTGDANSADSPLRASSTPRTSCATEQSRGSGSVRRGDHGEGGIDAVNHPRTAGSCHEEVSLSPASEESRSVCSQGSRGTNGDAVGHGGHHVDPTGDGISDADADSMLEGHHQAGDGAEDSGAVSHPKRSRNRQTQQQQQQECFDKHGNSKGNDSNGHATTPRRDGTGAASPGRANPSTPRDRKGGGSNLAPAFADEDPSGSKPRAPQTRTTPGGRDAVSKTPGSARRKLVARSPKVPSDDAGMKQAPAAMTTPKRHPEGAGPGHNLRRATPPPFKVGVTPTSSDRRGAATTKGAPTSTPRKKLCTKPALPVEAIGAAASSANPAKGNLGSGTVKSPTLSQSKAKSPRLGSRQTQLGGKSGDRVSHVASDVGKSLVEEENEALLPPRVSAVIPWEKNLRSSDSKSPITKKTVNGQSPAAGRPGKHGNGNLETKRVGRKVQKGTPANRGGNSGNGAVRRLLGEDSDGEEDTKGARGRGDGRPSIGTWNKTKDFLQILKEISGKDEEELEWLAVAKKGDGVKKSEKRRESAETEYFRLLCGESMQQAKLELLQDRRVGKALKAMVTVGEELRRLDEDYQKLDRKEQALEREDEKGKLRRTASASRLKRCQERDRLSEARLAAERKVGACLEEVRVGKEKLQALVETLRNEVSADESSAASQGGGGKGLGRRDALDIILGVCEDVCCGMEHAVPERAKAGLHKLEEAAKSLREELARTRNDSQTALTKMEKWRQRKEELPEYEKEKAGQEREWLEREREANGEALKRMRALCPAGVANLTVAQLEQRAVEAGSLYPRELAFRLKENRLLQWTVEHPDDIARANFLKGDHAHFFTNLDRYDLVELRAITACLPERFEVDGDGRKTAWRAAFLQRVQGLVAQERRECVTGGWDPEAQQRLVVQLPPLTSEQMRRPEYFYPTKLEVDERLGKLRAREEKLAAKRAQLDRVKDVLLPEAREEYANVLEDTRHPTNRKMYSADDLRRAREEARAAVDGLAKDVKRLESEVKSTERAIAEGPYTVQSLEAEWQATLALLKKRASGSRRPRVDLSADKGDRAGRRGLEEQENKNVKENEKHLDDDNDGGRSVNGENRETCKFSGTSKGVLGNSAVADGGDPDRKEFSAGEKGLGAAAKPCPRTEGEATAGVRMEVKGPFNPEPELRSRLGDRSRSLKFVTAAEDARMRKEELAKAIGARGAQEDGQPVETLKKASSEPGRPEGGKSSSSGDDGGKAVLVARTKAMYDTRGGVGERSRSCSNIKTFGAILEETLSRRLGQSPGAGPADVTGGTPKPPLPNGAGVLSPVARGGYGGMPDVSASLSLKVSREKPPVVDKHTPSRTVSPACVPKSKLFRSISNPVSPAVGISPAVVGAASALPVPSVLPSVPPPPPLPTAGSLVRVRAPGRGGGGGGGKDTKAMMGGILAEIRARAANRSNCMEKTEVEGRRSAAGNTVSSCSPAVAASGTPKRDPPPPPLPPSLPIQPRSLFGSSRPGESISCAGRGGAPAGPPPDLLADLRAKAMERIASRRAAATAGET